MLAFVWNVLARIIAQNKENEAARNMASALRLHASSGYRCLSPLSTRGALRMAGPALCWHWPNRRMARRSTHGGGNWYRVVGALASRYQLERRSHTQRRAPTDSHWALSRYSSSNLHRDSARDAWDGCHHWGSARTACRRHCVALFLREGAA